MSQFAWQKSSFSEPGGDTCVEVALDRTSTTYLRESDTPATVITTTPHALRALLREVGVGNLTRASRNAS